MPRNVRGRKAFHFDLDEDRLKEVYPSDSPTAYKSAWSKIRAFMESHGFEHTQYSGYESSDRMTPDRAFAVVASLNEAFPWFEKCAQAATITEVGRMHDALGFLRQERQEQTPSEGRPNGAVSLSDETRDMRDASDELGGDGLEPPDRNVDR